MKFILKSLKEVQAYLYYNTETKKFNMRLLENYYGMHPNITFKVLHDQGIVDVAQHLDRYRLTVFQQVVLIIQYRR